MTEKKVLRNNKLISYYKKRAEPNVYTQQQLDYSKTYLRNKDLSRFNSFTSLPTCASFSKPIQFKNELKTKTEKTAQNQTKSITERILKDQISELKTEQILKEQTKRIIKTPTEQTFNEKTERIPEQKTEQILNEKTERIPENEQSKNETNNKEANKPQSTSFISRCTLS